MADEERHLLSEPARDAIRVGVDRSAGQRLATGAGRLAVLREATSELNDDPLGVTGVFSDRPLHHLAVHGFFAVAPRVPVGHEG